MTKSSRQITNLRTYLVSALIFVIGIFCLSLSERLSFGNGYNWIKSTLSNFGGLLIATISIAVLWELFSKRQFLNELLEKTGLAEDIRTAGLTGISLNPLRGADFPKIIRNSERLDIFVCYANTWRSTHEEDLRYLASKKNCRVRLIVPDPENTPIMSDLAKRFNVENAEAMASKIRDAIREFKTLFLSAQNSTLDFSIWIHHETPVTSFYRFEKCAVITLYKHAKGRGNAPTLIAERNGALYSYIENEVDALVKGIHPSQPLAKKIFPL